MTAHLVEPFAAGADSDVVMVGPQTWTRAQVRSEMLALSAQWAADPAFHTASLVALDATSTPRTLIALWALVDLGIPFVPMHAAWPESQRRQVLSSTGAVLLSTAHSNSSHRLVSTTAHRRRLLTPESPLAVVFTSGSTGTPKGAILSHRAFVASAVAMQQWLGLRPNEVFFLSLPLAHVGGLAILTRASVLGGSVALPTVGNPGDGFDAARFVSNCAASRSTVVSLVPTQLQRICAGGLRAPPDVEVVLLGGAHSPPQLVRRAIELGWPIHRTYGLTEACSQVATDRVAGADGPLELLPHVAARLANDGRLALRGPALFSGYWGQPPRRADEWFVTSDLAALDGGGVTPLGRADDVVISGGENIYPEEVDAALTAAPGVAAACSFGRESNEWGQELCAAIVAKPNFDPLGLVAHLRGVLPSFKIPKAWIIVAELPLTPTGKLSRRLCQDAYSAQCRPFER
jgi:O-succinylbenzoic acid--CoA ligase